MGWTDVSIIVKMLIFRNSLLDILDSELIKQIFLEEFSKCKTNWSREIRQIAEEINQIDLIVDLRKFDLTAAKLALHEMFVLNWKILIDQI